MLYFGFMRQKQFLPICIAVFALAWGYATAQSPCTPIFQVTGGGTYCAGGAGVQIGLSDSEGGVEYLLKRDGGATGVSKMGTGDALQFGLQTLSGHYTVEANANGGACLETMDGSATVAVRSLTATLSPANSLTGQPLTVSLSAGNISHLEWRRNGAMVSTALYAQHGTTVAGGNGEGDAANQLAYPEGIFLAADGSLYIAELYNNRIQKWAPGATSGVTVAGGNGQGAGANQLAGPADVWVMPNGDIYVSDRYNNRIQRWAPGATSGITVAGGNGYGDGANQLASPQGIFVDASGNLYIADDNNNRIQKWAPGATTGITVAGGNGYGNAVNQLSHPGAIWVDELGNLYIADTQNDRIMRWAAGATEGTLVAGGNGSGLSAQQVSRPSDLWLTPAGTLWIVENEFFVSRVSEWQQGASQGRTIVGGNSYGDASNQFGAPQSLSVGPDGVLYVSDGPNARIQRFNPLPSAVPKTCGTWQAVAVDELGCIATSNTADVLTRGYADNDGDGYGDPNQYQDGCPLPNGYVPLVDCDDAQSTVYPGAPEICNDGLDNNCDGNTYEYVAPTAPAQIAACAGQRTEVAITPGLGQWYDAPTGGNVVATGNPAVVQLPASATLYVQQHPLQHTQLAWVDTTAALAVVEHDALTGDDGIGIAVTPEYLYYVGDDNMVRYDHNLQNGVKLRRVEALFGDLASGKIYEFRYKDRFQYDSIDRIQPLDALGQPNDKPILLSQPLLGVDYQSVVFNGVGFVLFYERREKKFYRIALPSGQVSVVKANYTFNEHQQAETRWAWYMAEYDGTDYSVVYRKSNTALLLRLNLTTEQKDTVVVFDGLGIQAAQFVFSPWDGRLFVHYEGTGSYSGSAYGEWLLAFDAQNSVQCATAPRTPVVFDIAPCPQPTDPTIRANSVTYHDAILDWTPATCTTPLLTDVYLSLSNTPPAPNAPATYEDLAVDSLSLNGLLCGRTYYIWLRTDCGNAGSSWAGPTALTLNQSLVLPNGMLAPGNAPIGQTLTLTMPVDSIVRIDWQNNGTTALSEPFGFAENGVTVAGGNGEGNADNQLYQPAGIFVTPDSTVYVADRYNHRVMKWTRGATVGVVVAGVNKQGDGPEQLNYPTDVWVDHDGSLYVVDQNNHRVLFFYPGSTYGSVIAGGNGLGDAPNQLAYPERIFVVNDTLYITDFSNNRVQKWKRWAYTGTTVAGGNGYGNALNQLSSPSAVWVDAQRNVFVADRGNHRIMKWAPGATAGVVVAGGKHSGSRPDQVSTPADLAMDADGNLFIAESQGDYSTVSKWQPGATQGEVVVGGLRGAASNQLSFPSSLFLDATGNLYVSDAGNARIQRFSAKLDTTLVPKTCGTWAAILTDTFGCIASTNSANITARWYADNDGDGYGDPNQWLDACPQPSGYVDKTDCDDTEATVYPGAPEICNDGLDNNCDGIYYSHSAPTVQGPNGALCAGGTAQLQATPGAILWYDAPVGGQLVATGNPLPFRLSSDTTLYAQQHPLQYSRIANVNIEATVAVVDHDALSGDDGIGIAVTPDYLYYVGDRYTARYDHNLQNGVQLIRVNGLCSDLSNGQLYDLRYKAQFSQDSIDRIQPLNALCQPDGPAILLSQPIGDAGRGSAVFSGFGYVLFYADGAKKFYRIALPSGQVTLIKAGYDLIDENRAETHWAWYYSEFDGSDYSIVYLQQNYPNLLRFNLGTEQKDTVATFLHLNGNPAQVAYSPWDQRLFIHEEGGSYYANYKYSEWLYAFEATNTVQCSQDLPRTPISLTVSPCPAPSAPTIRAGSLTTHSAILDWSPGVCQQPLPTDVYYAAQNTPPGAHTVPNARQVPVGSLALASLACGTYYYVWLRTDCGSEPGPWTGPLAFQTAQFPPLQVSPDTVFICESATATFTATALPNTEVRWFDAPIGGNLVHTGPDLTITTTANIVRYAGLFYADSSLGSAIFRFTNAEQTFVVPPGVTQLQVTAKGASGGIYEDGHDDSYYGKGGKVSATLAVTPGQVLRLYVGGRGQWAYGDYGGFNGGGDHFYPYAGATGGGASDIRIGGASLSNRVLVAGGGGGAMWDYPGGAGGGLIGGNGQGRTPEEGGGGGSQTTGGIGGISEEGPNGGDGTLGKGGSGTCCEFGSGAGGGGYYGGGGGGANYGSGGGGSSYTDPVLCAQVAHVQGDHIGDGIIELAWKSYIACETGVRTPAAMVRGIKPTVVCPANVVVNSLSYQCGNYANWTPPIGTDDCNGVTTVGSHTPGSFFPGGTTTITYTATDIAGLTGTCTFLVTVLDLLPPNIICPPNTVRSADLGQCNTAVTYPTPTASDNCGANAALSAGPASGSVFPVGTTTVVWVATDINNLTATCAFTVTVTDMERPNIVCPPNAVRSTDQGQCSATVAYATPTASDNCAMPTGQPVWVSGGNTPTSNGGNQVSVFPKGTTTVTWRATDAAGQTKTCTFRIIVNDTEKPAVTCPTRSPVSAAPGLCTAPISYTAPTYTDNCAPTTGVAVRVSGPASGSQFPVGTTNVIFRATDAAGNSTQCTMQVTVTDNEPPTFTACPTSTTVNGSGTPCIAVVFYPAPTASDNCSGQLTPFLVSGLSTGSNFPAGTTVNTWRAVATNGQTTECTFAITVQCGSNRPTPTEAGPTRKVTDASAPTLQLFPNPAVGLAWLDLSALGNKSVSLRLLDARGALVRQYRTGATPADKLQLDLDGLPPGLYGVQVWVDEQPPQTLKLVVQRL